MESESNKVPVTVLMSTYNGEKYLQEQLDSIFAQKGVQIKLIVRDDCSSDTTIDILKQNQTKHPEMKVIRGSRNLKPCKSFLRLVSANTSDDYYALSDQDDIWDDDKLIIAINQLREFDQKKPALYFSNLRVVDENNKFYRISHQIPRKTDNKYLSLMQPAATGCTLVYNKALAEIAERIHPQKFSMHDTWLYMVSIFFGNVVYDYEPHINYRQHSNNVIGTSLTGKKKSYLKTEIKRFAIEIYSQDMMMPSNF